MSAQEIQKFSQRFKASDLPGAAVHPDVVVSGVPESPSCNTSSESQDTNAQTDVISSKISSSTLSILKGSLSAGLAQEEEGGLQDTRAGNDEVDGGVVQEIMAKAASQDWEGVVSLEGRFVEVVKGVDPATAAMVYESFGQAYHALGDEERKGGREGGRGTHAREREREREEGGRENAYAYTSMLCALICVYKQLLETSCRVIGEGR